MIIVVHGLITINSNIKTDIRIVGEIGYNILKIINKVKVNDYNN